jgi:hypothetical protein
VAERILIRGRNAPCPIGPSNTGVRYQAVSRASSRCIQLNAIANRFGFCGGMDCVDRRHVIDAKFQAANPILTYGFPNRRFAESLYGGSISALVMGFDVFLVQRQVVWRPVFHHHACGGEPQAVPFQMIVAAQPHETLASCRRLLLHHTRSDLVAYTSSGDMFASYARGPERDTRIMIADEPIPRGKRTTEFADLLRQLASVLTTAAVRRCCRHAVCKSAPQEPAEMFFRTSRRQNS